MTTPTYRPIPLEFERLPEAAQRRRLRDYADWIRRRRTVR